MVYGQGKSLLGPAERDGVFIVAVNGRAGEGAKYNIWAIANGQQPPDSDAIKNTSKYIIALESIIDNDDEQLENYFGLIYKNSHKKAKEMVFDKPKESWFSIVNRELGNTLLLPSAETEQKDGELEGYKIGNAQYLATEMMQKGSELEGAKGKTFEYEADSDDDLELIESFVLKAGIKEVARNSSENHQRGHNDRPDPNMDARFFSDPNIVSREIMMDELDPSIYHQSLDESPSPFLSGSIPDPKSPSPQKAKTLSDADGTLNFWMRDWEKTANISNGKWSKRINADREKLLKSLPPLVASTGSSGVSLVQNDRNMRATENGYKFTRREKNLLAKTTVPRYRLGAKLINGKLVMPWGVNENGLEK